jgi:hypothetical protein
MGEKQNRPVQLSFINLLKIDFHGLRVTFDGGLILVHQLDGQLGFGDLVRRHLTDSRRGRATKLPLVDLLRQSVQLSDALRDAWIGFSIHEFAYVKSLSWRWELQKAETEVYLP